MESDASETKVVGCRWVWPSCHSSPRLFHGKGKCMSIGLHLLLLRICFRQLRLVLPLLSACSTSEMQGKTQRSRLPHSTSSFWVSVYIPHPLSSPVLFVLYCFCTTNPSEQARDMGTRGVTLLSQRCNDPIQSPGAKTGRATAWPSRPFKLLLYLLTPFLRWAYPCSLVLQTYCTTSTPSTASTNTPTSTTVLPVRPCVPRFRDASEPFIQQSLFQEHPLCTSLPTQPLILWACA